MNTYQGLLRRLGESTVDMKTETKTYSVVEIGDQILTNVRVSRKLANFVSDGVGGEVTLCLHSSIIAACTVNGKTYYEGNFVSPWGKLAAILCSIAGAVAFFVLTVQILGSVSSRDSQIPAISGTVAFFVGAVVSYFWGKRTFATPNELKDWKAQGASAV